MPDHLMPLQIVFLRVFGALVLIWMLEWITGKSKGQRIEKKDHYRLAFAALTGITLNQALFFTGLSITTPIDTAIINSTNPMIVLLLSVIFLHQPAKKLKILGVLLGFSGTLILILAGGESYPLHMGGIKGNILIVLNTLCWSIYLIIIKPLTGKYHPYVLMRWIFLYGFILLIPIAATSVTSIHFDSFTLTTWGSLIYIIVGTTFLAYLFITFGLSRLTPSVVAFYTYLQPVIVAVVGILIFSEGISMYKIVATLLIFTGIYLVNKNTSNT